MFFFLPLLCVDIHAVSYEDHLRSERHILLWDHLLYNTISYSKVGCTKHQITVSTFYVNTSETTPDASHFETHGGQILKII